MGNRAGPDVRGHLDRAPHLARLTGRGAASRESCHRSLRRPGYRGDLGLPGAAKSRLMDLAVNDVDAPVGARGERCVVGYDHYRLAAVGDIAQDTKDLLGRGGVEISRGLVGDNDLGTI